MYNLTNRYEPFEVTIGKDIYTGKLFVPTGPPPKLGEPVIVTVRRTGFHLSIDNIVLWLRKFGSIEGTPTYRSIPKLPTVKEDTLDVLMRLKNHIPSILPAFGKKLNVQYRGQPIQCGACFCNGHVRKECKNDRISFLTYVKQIINTQKFEKSMFGCWLDYIESSDRIVDITEKTVILGTPDKTDETLINQSM